MKTFKDVCHGVEYGTEGKRKWTKCGVLMIDGDKINLKLEYVPTTDFNGWLSVFDQDRKDKK